MRWSRKRPKEPLPCRKRRAATHEVVAEATLRTSSLPKAARSDAWRREAPRRAGGSRTGCPRTGSRRRRPPKAGTSIHSARRTERSDVRRRPPKAGTSIHSARRTERSDVRRRPPKAGTSIHSARRTERSDVLPFGASIVRPASGGPFLAAIRRQRRKRLDSRRKTRTRRLVTGHGELGLRRLFPPPFLLL